MKTKFTFIVAFLLCTSAHLLFCNQANAQYFKLYDFIGYSTDGSNPHGSFVYDGTYLYGMTGSGGTTDGGTIFQILPDGSGYNKDYSFGYAPDSRGPGGSLIHIGSYLYGMTGGGGTNGKGTIFKILPGGTTITRIFDFAGISNGANPRGSLIYDGTFLYGMTFGGGSVDTINGGYGVIFKIKPDGSSYTKLLDFNGTLNGSYPNSDLVTDGTYLYGMTEGGGANNQGVIFKIKTDGSSDTILLNFDGTNGDYAIGSLYYDGTFLYGMSGNALFKIKTDGTSYTKLLTFTGSLNGSSPQAGLICDGTYLYGMTRGGGTYSDGTVFKIKKDGSSYTKLLDFAGNSNGRRPDGDLVSVGAFIYGMTELGGTNDLGTIFKLGMGSGIEENNPKEALNIYPNPASDIVTLNLDSTNNTSLTLNIYNVIGALVKSETLKQNNRQINVGNLSNGIYMLTIKSNDWTATQKLIIQR